MTHFQKDPTPSVPPPGDPTQKTSTAYSPSRQKLPDTRHSITHKFTINGHDGYIIVGLFENGGAPGEVFLKMAKQGSTLAGLLDTVGILTSLCLQYGVPIRDLARKFEYMRFEPSGWTPNRDIKEATSIVDYIFRWLNITFPPENITAGDSNSPLSGTLPKLDSAGEGRE
jgi:ribonucleoside-diphosphate reductase alpha chain